MSKSNKEILEQANSAITQGDFEGFLALCTEDTAWTFEGERTLNGKAAVRQWMKTAYIEPPKFRVDRMIADDDFVAAIGEIVLKDETGKAVRHAYCDVWRFRDGKMAELRAFVVEAES
ncbi:nuclear transport factor 2 family protein [Steroidobacter flavus]|uniref:Nuclear transport factor 2 family protein n=1 Tax=Steroidobacter flavus TaxID=1842136 RepID=A0ABV8SMI6_9GAMM